MARLARVVAVGHPHHVTQRGNRRQRVFFCEEDYAAYLELLTEWCERCQVEVWAYCLMPNHVHLLLVPHTPEGLARAVGETHRRYTRRVNFRERWRGFLWQGRFASFPVEGSYGSACAQYIELNPVRARLAKAPEAWRWSSAKAHLTGKRNDLIRSAKPMRDKNQWARLLAGKLPRGEAEAIRSGERTGRPLGSDVFVQTLESELQRPLRKQKPGRKKIEEGK